MIVQNNLSEISERCSQILNSPYLRKAPPGELLKLRTLLGNVEALTRRDVPSLITEIKQLRAHNKRLENSMEEAQTA